MNLELITSNDEKRHGKFQIKKVATFVGTILGFVLTLDWQTEGFWQRQSRYFEDDPGPWCELDRATYFVRERSNGYSDFGFLTVAVLMALWQPASRQQHGYFGSFPVLARLGALVNLIHFAGTFLNHSSRLHFFHRLDVFGMWFLLYFWAIYWCLSLYDLLFPSSNNQNNHNHNHNNNNVVFRFSCLLAAGVAPLWYLSDVWYHIPFDETLEIIIFVIIIAPAIVSAVVYAWLTRKVASFKPALMVAVLVVLPVGALLQRADRHGLLCLSPTHWFQGHAVWHLCTSFAAWKTFHFAVSQTPSSSSSFSSFST